MIWRLLSIAIFALTAGGVAYLIFYTPIDERLSDLEYTPSIAYLVQPNSSMAFSTNGPQKSSNHKPTGHWQHGFSTHMVARLSVSCPLERHRWQRRARAGLPRANSNITLSITRRRTLSASLPCGIWRTPPRCSDYNVAGETILPEGGAIEISLPPNSPPLYFNATGEQFRSDVEAQQRKLSLAAHQKDKLVRRLGIMRWSMLNEEEKWSLVQHEWKALAPKGQINRNFTSAWIMQSDYELPWSYPQLMGTTLTHNRALALNLVGPVTLRLSGPKEIGALELYTIADAPDEAIVSQVSLDTDQPIGLSMEERGFKLDITHEGPISLHLKNTQIGDVGPIIFSVDEPQPEQFLDGRSGPCFKT